ncbi:MAG TPA: C13 family peptidase [Rhizomicrobium sp.]|nr:C13 family peptidase [Rhizomicrobium sp.]
MIDKAMHLSPTHLREGWLAILAVFVLSLAYNSAHASSPYAKWAAVVVSGDWHAHDGSPSEIFDNARRDVTRDLETLGFSRNNIAEFSARPGSWPPATAHAIRDALSDISWRAKSGCLVYFSSHGSPDGIVLGNSILEPYTLARMLNASCGDRPTVVVLSACFSGVFVPTLKAHNRMILTAARRDRTSFGCGQTDRYPYFDQCVLSVWPYADSFAALGRAAQICVAARERREHVGPPSQPQLWLGADAANEIPKWR